MNLPKKKKPKKKFLDAVKNDFKVSGLIKKVGSELKKMKKSDLPWQHLEGKIPKKKKIIKTLRSLKHWFPYV